jgi:gluconate 5-dehydrogenase
MSLFSLKGRRALITGSSRGIGFALAQALGEAGANIILNSRNQAELQHAVSRLQEKGIDVNGVAFDVTQTEAVSAGLAELSRTCGDIDILVNNAGIQRRAPLEQFNDDDWHELMRTNLDSVYYMSKAIAPQMIARGYGKIINIASVQSELARPTIAPYTASKGAVKNLTKGMCADWAKHGIQVNALGPGYFNTPLTEALQADPTFDAWIKGRTPAGRWGQLEDLHGAIVFLASDASNFVNGQTIYVDGGLLSVV